MDLSDAQGAALASLVTPPEAHAVLWHFQRTPGVMEPGSFIQSLIDTIAKADPSNRQRLGLGFPGHVAAVQLAQGDPHGVSRLQRIAGIPYDSVGTCAICEDGLLFRDGKWEHIASYGDSMHDPVPMTPEQETAWAAAQEQERADRAEFDAWVKAGRPRDGQGTPVAVPVEPQDGDR